MNYAKFENEVTDEAEDINLEPSRKGENQVNTPGGQLNAEASSSSGSALNNDIRSTPFQSPALSPSTFEHTTSQRTEETDPTQSIPPGLEYLASIDELLVHQQVEACETMCGAQTENRYSIKNTAGEQCYFAEEESDLCMKLCCGNARGFEMHIVNNNGYEVIYAYRHFTCAGCCWCVNGKSCAYVLEVESPTGVPIGNVTQLCSGWRPRYAIQNEFLETVLIIEGPFCLWQGPCCPCEVPMEILTADGSQCIGSLTRQYAGCIEEYASATNYSLSFPLDLDVRVKALLLSATFLIDMMYFERKK